MRSAYFRVSLGKIHFATYLIFNNTDKLYAIMGLVPTQSESVTSVETHTQV